MKKTKYVNAYEIEAFLHKYYDEDHLQVGILEHKLAQLPEVIIRCNECKYASHWYADIGRCFLWNENGNKVFNNGFCSYAERSEHDIR